jgi:hypothetical protein
MHDEIKITEYNKNKYKKFVKSRIDLNNNDHYREIIDQKFTDPNHYFDNDDKIIIGKLTIT